MHDRMATACEWQAGKHIKPIVERWTSRELTTAHVVTMSTGRVLQILWEIAGVFLLLIHSTLRYANAGSCSVLAKHAFADQPITSWLRIASKGGPIVHPKWATNIYKY
jgi:hypothetical protein